ncbi:MAG: hypothetical protein ABUL69_02370 [Peristeroidobacter soli]
MNPLAVALTSLALAACAAAPPPDLKKVGPDGEVTLAMGERVLLDKNTVVKLVNVVEDSRCPVDTTCIWAGEVKILLEGSMKDRKPTYLREGGSTLVDNYQVTLVRVEPQPVSTAKIAPKDYRATLRVAH